MGDGIPSGWRNSAVTANQSARPPTTPAFEADSTRSRHRPGRQGEARDADGRHEHQQPGGENLVPAERPAIGRIRILAENARCRVHHPPIYCPSISWPATLPVSGSTNRIRSGTAAGEQNAEPPADRRDSDDMGARRLVQHRRRQRHAGRRRGHDILHQLDDHHRGDEDDQHAHGDDRDEQRPRPSAQSRSVGLSCGSHLWVCLPDDP